MSTATAELKPGTEVDMKFAWIPPGRFLMGSDENGNEEPVHRVSISKGFWMGIYQVTQFQFEAVMGYNPSYFRGPDRPVEMVSWHDAQEFCVTFSMLTGRPICLPTEAEWEYACRAGTTSAYWSGNDETAFARAGWHSEPQTRPVGKLAKNPWGLYDVHGNVWEWCADLPRTYSANDQSDPIGESDEDEDEDGSVLSNHEFVLRGGSWNCNPSACRASCRYWDNPQSRFSHSGFRVCFRLD